MAKIAAIKDKDMARIIGSIMRWGVICAISLALAGGIIFLIKHGNEPIDFNHYTEIDNALGTILKNTLNGLLQGSGRAFITAGILLLFATPVIRVVFSLIGFILEKDKTYIVITLVVLAILFISITGGLAH